MGAFVIMRNVQIKHATSLHVSKTCKQVGAGGNK